MIVFLELAEDVVYNELINFDQLITGIINIFQSPSMTRIMKGITLLGSTGAIIGIALLSWLYLRTYKKRLWDANIVLICLAGSFVLNWVLKWAIHRSRPDIVPMISAAGYSFPSAHAMVSFAFYGILVYLIWVNLNPSRFKYLLISGLSLLVFLIGISRIYLGVHYPSDVAAGFAAGGVWLVGCVLGRQTIRYYKST